MRLGESPFPLSLCPTLLTPSLSPSLHFSPYPSPRLLTTYPDNAKTGLRPTVFEPGTEDWSKARKLYAGKGKIWERHRHRYEVNPAYVERLVQSGCVFAGKDERGERMQVLELRGASPRFLSFSFHVS